MREQYNREKEHEVIGTYPPIRGLETTFAKDGGMPETPKLYRPIPRYENFHMLYEGKTPYWMVNTGWLFCDMNNFRPRQHPDNRANHQCIDGGDFVDYEAQGNVCKGWFGLPLEWEADSMGATVRPGNPMIEDMNDWHELNMPNLDEMNFEEMAEMNKEYLGTDKANQLGIQLGLWERMMCLMDVENAAVALLDEDQETAVHEFLDALSDIYIDYIGRVSKICRLDAVFFHDDWGTQNNPFFSLDVCRKFFVPAMKKIVSYCHDNGIVFEHHCCGNAEPLIPAMVECGTDFWYPQPAINNLDRMIETYWDEHITFAVTIPVIPKGSTEEQVREQAREFVDKYKDKRVSFCRNNSLLNNPDHDPSMYPVFEDAVYEFSRIAYQDVDDQGLLGIGFS